MRPALPLRTLEDIGMGLDRSPEQLLKAGLAALKQKDYGRAISTFQQISQTDGSSTSHQLKAQMGLIRTYEEQGNHDQARDLCKPLLKSRSQAIRQWAHEKLQQLTTIEKISIKQPVNNLDNVNQASGVISNTSGFVPFNAEERTVPQVSDSAHSSDISTPQTKIQDFPQEQKSVTDRTSVSSTPSKATATPEANLTEQQVGSSLFHYQNLNNNRRVEHKTDITNTSTETDPKVSAASQTENFSANLTQLRPNKQPKRPVKTTIATALGPETWPQGSRLRTLKSLGKVSMGRLWFAQLATIPIIFWVVRWLVKTALSCTRDYLLFLNRLLPINLKLPDFFWGTQTWTVIIGFGALTLAAPWLWSFLLRPTKNLSTQQLKSYSPEASQLLRRFCAQRHWPVPKVQLITSDLPLIFSYGWRPRHGKIVVSQGLLEHLAADELAAVMMYEISHWSTLDWIFFSTHGLLLQGFHRVYWFLAQWGENRSALLKITAGTIANLSYGIFWLLTQVSCGLARIRTPYRDRKTAELTGNPNGLIRALAKLSAAMANTVNRQGYTPQLLESLDLMLPVGPTSVGTSSQHFAWGAFNPLRHWLSLNQGHPPLGDRIYIINAYGRHWKLTPSLNFAQLQLKHGSRALTQRDWKNLLLQAGAWSGLMIGLGVAMIMWLMGAIATHFDLSLLAWLYKDRSILLSMPLIGTATGHLLRINPFFPEIADSIPINEAELANWQTDPTLVPLSSLPIKINGTLTGRPALANWLGQEWRLRTKYGSIKLHHTAYFGPLSNIQGLTPWLNTPLQVTGWFRRGHHIWIDIDRLRTQQNQTKLAQHPLWAAMISAIPLAYGLWIIFKGV
ncbi:M48 family metalloprotease [Leptothoe spongobia]|uniref:M48 family metalloprotease n=1 Tax=Leptothoe spongobia TAU-MAC 1115 TaxID=1967444 RepID=A0A947GI23_9CYAN|nr:zinc metalloprotease HtpX [Leptothoe spongobia]MBT9315369.1 M48 family metalloprotease [Leptothoe spongobia TAU-MAC 1115]